MPHFPDYLFGHFFISGGPLPDLEKGAYIPHLVALSYIIASLGSFTGLRLASDIRGAETEKARNVIHFAGAFAFGAGIWSMHFIGMLAYKMHMTVSYDPVLTTLSMIIAIIIAYGVLQIVRSKELKARNLCLGALLLGTAICAMHYTGMAAMEMDGGLRYMPSLFLLSFIIAVTASGAALWIVFTLGQHAGRWKTAWQSLAALIMGAAICGMHYTGMTAAVFIPRAGHGHDPGQQFDTIATVIAVLCGIVFGIALAMEVYHREKAVSGNQKARDAFPVRLTTTALGLTFAVIVWMGISSFMSYRTITDNTNRNIEISRLANEVMRLDGILTESAKMASVTGETKWEQRYNENVAKLDEVLAALKKADPAPEKAKTREDLVAATDEANNKLVEMEKRNFELVHQGRQAEARAIMEGLEYTKQKRIYAKGTQDMIYGMHEAMRDKFLPLAQHLYYGLFPIFCLSVMLIVLWFFTFRSLRSRHRELVETRNQAEQASRIKSEFLANMSHELRTPLNSILGIIHMFAEDKGLDEDRRAMAGIVHKSAANLLEIVNDILDISKIEAGNMTLENIGFDVRATVSGIIETLAPTASAKGIALNYSFKSSNGDLPFVKGDPLRFGRIITNLVSNAIKYTETGGVYVEIEHQPSGGGRIDLLCTIRDTGIGIPEDKQAIIFQKFTQADASTTRKYGGTGLGLAITKDLVELMGGKIGVESTPGKGSSFWFRIPFAVALRVEDRGKKAERNKRIPAANRISAASARVLVAEDYLLNQMFIQRLLNRMGFTRIDICGDGLMALKSLDSSVYDLILMDCHMPEKNGYEVTREIRAREAGTGRRTPIIALTADVMRGTREKCIEAGMDEYISKPIDAEEFEDIIGQWMEIAGTSGESPAGKYPDHADAAGTDAEIPVDASALRKFVDNDGELKQYIDIYLAQAEEDLKNLSLQCTDGKNPSWIEAAHRMKGGAGMAGAEKLSRLCAQAQAMDPAPQKERAHMVEAIKKEFERVKGFLEKIA